MRKIAGGAPSDSQRLAIGLLGSRPQSAAEDNTNELHRLTVGVGVGLMRRVAADGEEPGELDHMAELLETLTVRRVGEGLTRLEPASWQAPFLIIAPLDQEELSRVVEQSHSGRGGEDRVAMVAGHAAGSSVMPGSQSRAGSVSHVANA